MKPSILLLYFAVFVPASAVWLGGLYLLRKKLDFWPRTASGGWDPRGYSAALAVSLLLQLVIAARLIGGKR